jgi:hypothetical protein
MYKPKRKNQPFQTTIKLHRAQEFDFTVALSLEECIERIQRLSHKAKRFTIEMDVMVAVVDSLNGDAQDIHIRWGAEMSVHIESLLTFIPIDNSTTRIRGCIGVVNGAQLGYVMILNTWMILVNEIIQQRGLSVDVTVVLGFAFLTMAIAAYIMFGLLILMRPIETRLESIHYAFENDEKLKRAVQQLEIEEAFTIGNAEISEAKEALKRPNHVPR